MRLLFQTRNDESQRGGFFHGSTRTRGADAAAPATFSYEHEGDRQFATTLARGLEVLRCFTPLEPLLGNKEISVRTGLPKPTVSRLTYTLTKLGYLRHNMRLGKYQLGSAVLSIGYPLLASMNVRQVAPADEGARRLLQRLGVDGRARPPEHGVRRVLPQRQRHHHAARHRHLGADLAVGDRARVPFGLHRPSASRCSTR